MKRSLPFLLCALLFLGLIMPAGLASGQGDAPTAATQGPGKVLPDGVFVVRVYYNTVEDSKLLTDFDLFEYNNQEEHYFLAAVDRGRLEAPGGTGLPGSPRRGGDGQLRPAVRAAG